MKKISLLICLTIMGIVILLLTGCTDAEVVDENLTKDADNFKVYRHIVFINNITGEYLLEITGYCNITADTEDKQLETISYQLIQEGYIIFDKNKKQYIANPNRRLD